MQAGGHLKKLTCLNMLITVIIMYNLQSIFVSVVRKSRDSTDENGLRLLHTTCQAVYELRRDERASILLTKGEVIRATKLLQLATKSDFNAC